MLFDKKLTVSGVEVEILPYTVTRQKQLNAVKDTIQEFLDANPSLTWEEIPIKTRAKFWQAKADVLWQGTYPKGFFESEDFEYSLLKDTEIHFMTMQVYL